MTEPNEPTTPLTRMRFSWQRGSGLPGTPTAPEEVDDREFDAGEDDRTEQPEDLRREDAPEPEASVPGPESTSAVDELSETSQEATNGRPSRLVEVSRDAAPDQSPIARPPSAAPPPEEEPPVPGPSFGPVVREVDRPATQTDEPKTPPGSDPRTEARGKGKNQTKRQKTKPKDAFSVPPPGGRFSGGRGAHVGIRVVLILTTCLLALGIVAYIAFSFGVATMRENTYRLSEKDIGRYNLTDFPLEQAGRFAADYARLCLTHSSTPGAADQREARLARFVSAGTDTSCGWNGEGVQTVTDSSWTGASEPLDLPGYAEHARMMAVRVLTSSGSRIVTVPVYVANLATGDGLRVVGDIGEMPQPRLVAAPKPTAPAEVDTALGEALVAGEFFRQFFDAWGASNGAALQRFVTPDASPTARGGLGGTLSAPQIDQAQVFFPPGADPNDPEFEWRTGMVTEAWVWVIWKNPAVGKTATERRAYRLQMVKTTQAASPAQEWTVRDIKGGVPDLEGG